MKSPLLPDEALRKAREISLGFSALWLAIALIFLFLKTEQRLVVMPFAILFLLIGIVLYGITLLKTKPKAKNFDPPKGTFLARWRYTPQEWTLFTSTNITDNQSVAKGSGIALFIACILVFSMILMTDETIRFQLSIIITGVIIAGGFGSLVWMLVRVLGLMRFVRYSRIVEPEAVITTSQLRIGNEEFTWGSALGLMFRCANVITENSSTFLEFEFSGRNNSDVRILVPPGKENELPEIVGKLNENSPLKK
ncbi:MAG: hypothetical protein V4642_06915 [Bacteroidota bacterium]